MEAPKLPAIPDPKELEDVFKANFEGITPSFEIIKIPSGGLTSWAVPNEEGDADMEKELVGVVLDHYTVRGYWEKKYGEGGTVPPVCSSLDGVRGSLPRNQEGAFGDCKTCKWAEFGTALKPDGSPGRGQACRLKHRVFLLMPDKSIFPYLIPLSVMSATKKYDGSFSTYVLKLGGKLKKVSSVISRLKLIKDTNADGQEYAKAQFFFAGDIKSEDKEKIAWLKQTMGPTMRNRPFEAEEADEVDEQPTETRGGEQREADQGRDPWDREK